jgi:hypothetical protein
MVENVDFGRWLRQDCLRSSGPIGHAIEQRVTLGCQPAKLATDGTILVFRPIQGEDGPSPGPIGPGGQG